MYSLLAMVLTSCSALALYAGSPHCRWSALHGHPRIARGAGWVLALMALLVWTQMLGGAAGLCAMLANWMLALVAQPYLARLFGTPEADVEASDFSRRAPASFAAEVPPPGSRAPQPLSSQRSR